MYYISVFLFQYPSEVVSSTTTDEIPKLDTTYEFLDWYDQLNEQDVKKHDEPYEAYYRQLEERRNECVALTNQVPSSL